jgi:hypothetical protein
MGRRVHIISTNHHLFDHHTAGPGRGERASIRLRPTAAAARNDPDDEIHQSKL